MKKIIIFLIAFLFCIVGVDAYKFNNLQISEIKYETYDTKGNKQEGTLKFETIYIYNIKEI